MLTGQASISFVYISHIWPYESIPSTSSHAWIMLALQHTTIICETHPSLTSPLYSYISQAAPATLTSYTPALAATKHSSPCHSITHPATNLISIRWCPWTQCRVPQQIIFMSAMALP